MTETILAGHGCQIIQLPRKQWEEDLAKVPMHMKTRLAFMTQEHHAVRYFVVKELPRYGKPMPAEFISRELRLPISEVERILDELEKNLFFLVRNDRGAVSWAFPVTVETTPHRLRFSTGEETYAAWAEDAIAAPFVQGRLREERLEVAITTECARSGRPIHLTIDSDLKFSIGDEGARPIVFEPEVNWPAFSEPNLIKTYWRNSLFFWSEEHARQFQAEADRIDGLYLTMEQMAYSTKIAQGALFAFWISE
jgi:alkylmercury lyase-like protein